MLLIEVWFELGADRQLGYGMRGDIPTLAIRAWAASEGEDGLDRDATRFLIRVIRYVDGWRNEREASKSALEGG